MKPDFLAGAVGVGVNSIAYLIGYYERGIRPDVLTFADTGGELPHTYKILEQLQKWCKDIDFPEINIVRKVNKEGEIETLEENCLRIKSLPSLAYGFKKCSHKFKIEPQDKFMNNYPPAKAHWKAGNKVTKAIGYSAEEWHRQRIPEDKKYIYVYPLHEWRWDRSKCIEKCKEYSFCPAKSACFYCPATKKAEVIALSKMYPDHFKRAIEIEKNSAPTDTDVKGLGRYWSWQNIVEADEAQLKMFEEAPDLGCGCMNL